MKIKSCIEVTLITIGIGLLPAAGWAGEAPSQTQTLDRVAAVVDEDVIMASELTAREQMIAGQIKKSGSAAPPPEVLRQQVLERLIVENLQLQMGKRAGIKIADEQLQQALNDIAAQNHLSIAAFKPVVEQQGMLWGAFEQNIRREMIMQQVQQSVVSKRIRISEQDIDNFLKTKEGHDLATQAAEMAPITQTLARHILIKTSEIRNDEEARALLEKLRSSIKKPNDFAVIAKQNSEDTGSALKGGDLGWTMPGQMVPEFEKALDATAAGEISAPFHTQFGWHIVQVLERRKQDMSQDALRQQATLILRKRQYQDELPRWLKEIRDKAYVKIQP